MAASSLVPASPAGLGPSASEAMRDARASSLYVMASTQNGRPSP
jgi:hypothetical protein